LSKMSSDPKPAAAAVAAAAAAATAVAGAAGRSPTLAGLWRSAGVGVSISARVSARGGGGGGGGGGGLARVGEASLSPTSPPVGLSPELRARSASGLLRALPEAWLEACANAALTRGEGGEGGGCARRVLSGEEAAELGAEQTISRDTFDAVRAAEAGAGAGAGAEAEATAWLATLCSLLEGLPRKVFHEGRRTRLASLLPCRFRSGGSHRLRSLLLSSL